MATFDHGVPGPGALALRAPADRITATVMKVLCATLAAVYGFSAVTLPAGHAPVTAGEAGIAAAQLGWIALVSVRGGSAWVYRTGIVVQLALTALWIVTRSVGLPGIGRLPVGEFDLLCAIDGVAIAGLAWRCAPWAGAATARMRTGLCQLAVILAACTVYMSMASMMAMTASGPAHAGRSSAPGHGQVTVGFFCHLL